MPHFFLPRSKKETTASALKPLSATKVTVYFIRSNISTSYELGEVGFDLFQHLIVEFCQIEGFCDGELVNAEAFGAPQIRFVKAGIFEICTHQVSVAQIGLHEKSVTEIGFDEKRFVEAGFDEKRVLEVRAAGECPLQVGLVEI